MAQMPNGKMMAMIPIPQAHPIPPGLTISETMKADTHYFLVSNGTYSIELEPKKQKLTGRTRYGKNWKLTPKPLCLVVVMSAMTVVFRVFKAVMPQTLNTVPRENCPNPFALAARTSPRVTNPSATG